MAQSRTDRILWYGERGIVNAIVTHIAGQTSHDDYVRSVKAFLDAIEWADDHGPGWISQITNARFAVEPSFADFGSPDLMVVCEVANAPKRYCVFIEAKARPYWLCTGDNLAGMVGAYNSTINGQMSLKYRLATALENGCSSNGAVKEVTETGLLWERYKKHLKDPSTRPRHLLKQESLRVLDDLGLIGMPLANACFVAMTWDDPKRVFFSHAGLVHPSRNLPVFLDESGTDRFEDMRAQVGWLGYAQVKKALPALGDAFTDALHTMCDDLVPGEAHYFPRSVAETPAHIRELAEALCADLQRAVTDRWRTEELKTGWSLIGPDGKTHVKVVPQDGSVYVGIQEYGGVALDRAGLTVTDKIPGYEFCGVEIGADTGERDRTIALQPILRELRKRLG